MKKFLFTIAMAVSLQFAIAQETVPQEKPAAKGTTGHHRKTDWQSLNLTEDQQNKMADLRKEHKAKMLAILTPEQRKTLEQQKAEKKARFAEKSALRMEKMKTRLKLSPDQSEKMTRLNQDFRQQTELIRANEALAAAEQHKQLKALAKAHQTDIKAILDPSQQAILEEMKARRNKPATK